MGDAGPGSRRPRVAFHLTGFGPFAGVPDNPTAALLADLPAALERRPLPDGAELASHRVLCTSAASARAAVRELHAAPAGGDGEEQLRVLVHLGVAMSAGRFRLERTAYNDATFRVPDETGFQPSKEPVEAADGPFGLARRTTLPLERVQARLAGRGHPVVVSDDAGRYVCNFTYYLSLAGSADGRSVFVHVPSFERVPRERQVDFVRDVLAETAEQLWAGP